MEDPSWQEQSPRMFNVLEALKQALVEKSTSKRTLIPTQLSSTHLPLKLRSSSKPNPMPSSPRTHISLLSLNTSSTSKASS
ncbi:hypothetical protein AB3S75_001569 [Citrus x aurantiifolia]